MTDGYGATTSKRVIIYLCSDYILTDWCKNDKNLMAKKRLLGDKTIITEHSEMEILDILDRCYNNNNTTIKILSDKDFQLKAYLSDFIKRKNKGKACV